MLVFDMPSNSKFYISLTAKAFLKYIHFQIGAVQDCTTLHEREQDYIITSFQCDESCKAVYEIEENVIG